MSAEVQALAALEGELKVPRTSRKIVDIMDSLEGQFQKAEELRKRLRRRLRLWRTMAMLGIDFKAQNPRLIRGVQASPDMVTALEFEERVQHRIVQKPAYPEWEQTYIVDDRGRQLSGVLLEDFDEWLQKKAMKKSEIFYLETRPLPSSHGRMRVVFMVLNKMIDLPKRMVVLPEPLSFPNRDDAI